MQGGKSLPVSDMYADSWFPFLALSGFAEPNLGTSPCVLFSHSPMLGSPSTGLLWAPGAPWEAVVRLRRARGAAHGVMRAQQGLRHQSSTRQLLKGSTKSPKNHFIYSVQFLKKETSSTVVIAIIITAHLSLLLKKWTSSPWKMTLFSQDCYKHLSTSYIFFEVSEAYLQPQEPEVCCFFFSKWNRYRKIRQKRGRLEVTLQRSPPAQTMWWSTQGTSHIHKSLQSYSWALRKKWLLQHCLVLCRVDLPLSWLWKPKARIIYSTVSARR